MDELEGPVATIGDPPSWMPLFRFVPAGEVWTHETNDAPMPTSLVRRFVRADLRVHPWFWASEVLVTDAVHMAKANGPLSGGIGQKDHGAPRLQGATLSTCGLRYPAQHSELACAGRRGVSGS